MGPCAELLLPPVPLGAMSYVEPLEDTTPLAHVTIAYLGPVAPHWEIRGHFGDTKMIDDFWTRVTARLLLLPRHDPQFRRNKERVNRDAERERITLDWDLGDEDSSNNAAAARRAAAPRPAPVAETVEVVEVAEVVEPAVDPVVEAAPAPESDEAESTSAPAEA